MEKPRTSKMIGIGILQVILAVVCSFIFASMFPRVGLDFVIGIGTPLEKLGIIDLVGEPGSADPAAVLVVLFFLVLASIFSFLIFKKTPYKPFAVSFFITSIILSFGIFVVVSSILWF